MSDKRTYVLYSELQEIEKKYDLNYLIIYGGRNDGKSYAAKEKALRDYFDHGAEFSYLRRYDSDVKRNSDNTLYFADFMTGKPNKIQELSGKAWDGIKADKGRFWLYTLDDAGKQQTGPAIGYIHALSIADKRYKSLQFPEVETVIYEEFCTGGGDYLYNESRLFNNYISTIARDRRISVYMIGNTISRHNVFFREWEMVNIPKQKPGTVDVYSYDNDGVIIRVGAYYTNAIKQNKMFFGHGSKMITGGEWDSTEQPKLERPESDYMEVYRVILEIDFNNRFMCRFMCRDMVGVWYITPKTTPPKDTDRIISPTPRESLLYTNSFIPINDAERKLFPYLQMGRIAYSDNLTGTEFKRGMAQLSTINGFHAE